MSAIRIAVAVLGAAAAVSRSPVVRAGVRAVMANPRARDAAVEATRTVAYNAGVAARHLLGRRIH